MSCVRVLCVFVVRMRAKTCAGSFEDILTHARVQRDAEVSEERDRDTASQSVNLAVH